MTGLADWYAFWKFMFSAFALGFLIGACVMLCMVVWVEKRK